MPINKRAPDAFPDDGSGLYWQFMHLSKADWADLYADLYRQTHGEEAVADAIIADAYGRLKTLQLNGLAGGRKRLGRIK